VFMYMCRGVCLQACPFIRPCLLDKIDNNTNTNAAKNSGAQLKIVLVPLRGVSAA